MTKSLNNPDKSNSDFAPPGLFQEIATSILLVQQGFLIQTEKVKKARICGNVGSTEYGQWVECFERLSREWLDMDFSSSENILFLKMMSMKYYQMTRELKFPMSHLHPNPPFTF